MVKERTRSSLKQAIVAVVFAAVIFLGGCGKTRQESGSEPTSKKDAASPSPAASTSPLPVSAVASDIQLSLLNAKGQTVARIKAESGALVPASGSGPTKPGDFGTLGAGQATLYKEGKPQAIITADRFRADRNTRIITAQGNAIARSLSDPRAPVVRADTMTWSANENRITGQGNVLATMKPDWSLPGSAFTADTQLRKMHMTHDTRAASGSM